LGKPPSAAELIAITSAIAALTKIHVTATSIANLQKDYHWSVGPYVTAVTGDAVAADAADHLNRRSLPLSFVELKTRSRRHSWRSIIIE
jgi:hypothetical protein